MNKNKRFLKRKLRTRKRTINPSRARLSVFRSNRHIYAQIIDDLKGVSITSSSDLKIAGKGKEKPKKVEVAGLVGEDIAKKSLKKKISQIVFDKGGYKYHGRVKALAEGARKGGLKF